ncbi:MAG TPA: hypothetical protein VFD33_06970 [Bacillota bacterium]|nr:hypothetical protein [Bacillota bacterium]
MAKFCSYCGSELQGGQDCSCQEAAPATEDVSEQVGTQDIPVKDDSASQGAPVEGEAAPQQVAPKKPSNFSKYLDAALNTFKAFVKKPVSTTVKSTEKEAWQSGLMLLVVNILVVAITSATITARIYAMGLGSLASIFGVKSTGGFVLWITTFFSALLIKTLLYAMLAGLVYLGIKIVTKKELGFLKIVTALSVATISLTLIGLVSFIIAIAAPSFANRIMGAANLIFMILFYLGVNAAVDADTDKSFYAIAVSLFVYGLTTIIF